MDDIQTYKTSEGYFTRPPAGLLGSSAFVKRELEGQVSLFSRIDTYAQPMPGAPGMPSTSTFNYSKKTFFSKAGEPLQKTTYQNLQEALGDNDKSMEYLQKYRSLKAAQNISLFAGVGLALHGLISGARRSEETFQPAPTLYVGLGLAGGSYLFSFSKASTMEQAIEAYNQ